MALTRARALMGQCYRGDELLSAPLLADRDLPAALDAAERLGGTAAWLIALFRLD